jgi:hypothetical protein
VASFGGRRIRVEIYSDHIDGYWADPDEFIHPYCLSPRSNLELPVVRLSHHHRDTLEKIFARPSSANVEWRQVRSLLEAVGAADEQPNGRLRVTLGQETEVRARTSTLNC